MGNAGIFLSYVLIAVFAQNLLLDKAIGLSCILTAVKRKYALVKLSLIIGIYCTVGMVIIYLFSLLFSGNVSFLVCALIYSLICAVVYFASDRALLKISPEAHDVWADILPHALINSIVIGAPLVLIAGRDDYSLAQVLGCGVGTGLSFALAVLLVKNGMEILDQANMPKAFRGTPAMLIYLGILSLGFSVLLKC